MALECEFYASADLSLNEILAFMAHAIDGQILGDYARRDTLDATPWDEDSDEVESDSDALGFDIRTRVTFRFSGKTTLEERASARIAMFRAVLDFFGRYGGDGVLLHNGERIIMRRIGGSVICKEGWEEWSDPGVRELVAGLERRSLAQPFL